MSEQTVSAEEQLVTKTIVMHVEPHLYDLIHSNSLARADRSDDMRIHMPFSPSLVSEDFSSILAANMTRPKAVPKAFAPKEATLIEQVVLTLFNVWRRLGSYGFTHFAVEGSQISDNKKSMANRVGELMDVHRAVDVTVSSYIKTKSHSRLVSSAGPVYLQLKSTIARSFPLKEKTWCFKVLNMLSLDYFAGSIAPVVFKFVCPGRSPIKLAGVPACGLLDSFGVTSFTYGRFHDPNKTVRRTRAGWTMLHEYRFDSLVDVRPIGRALIGSHMYSPTGDSFIRRCKQNILSNIMGNQVVLDIPDYLVESLDLAEAGDVDNFYNALRKDIPITSFIGESAIFADFFKARPYHVLEFFNKEAFYRSPIKEYF